MKETLQEDDKLILPRIELEFLCDLDFVWFWFAYLIIKEKKPWSKIILFLFPLKAIKNFRTINDTKEKDGEDS